MQNSTCTHALAIARWLLTVINLPKIINLVIFSLHAESTVGRINFEDKKFRGFHGYLLNFEIKYPRNFLHNRSGRFHVHMVGKWLALWKYFKRAAEVKTPLPLPIPAVQLFRAIFSCRAANKEVQRVIGPINNGTLYTY